MRFLANQAGLGFRLAGFHICALLLLTACGRGGDRTGETADTAVVRMAQQGDTAALDSTRDVAGGYKADSIESGTDAVLPEEPSRHPARVTILAADSTAGQELYRGAASCMTCHDLRGRGIDGLGSALNDEQWIHGDGSLGFIEHVISAGISSSRHGNHMMPGMRDALTRHEIFLIASYVYTLSRPRSTVPDSLSLPPDAPPLARPPGESTPER